MYYVYMLRCADGMLYTGITLDLERRLEEHNASPLGAKYTRTRRPVEVVFFQEFSNRSAAASEEFRIKKLSRSAKLKMIRHRKAS